MRANLDPAAAAERAAGLLAPALGRERAHEAAADAASAARTQRRPLADVLRERAGAHLPAGLDDAALAAALDPAASTGHAGLFVDRALAAHTRPARVDPHPPSPSWEPR